MSSGSKINRAGIVDGNWFIVLGYDSTKGKTNFSIYTIATLNDWLRAINCKLKQNGFYYEFLVCVNLTRIKEGTIIL